MKEALDKLKEKDMIRYLISSENRQNKIVIDGKSYLNFSSNDYLGISSRVDWQEEFLNSLDKNQYLMGATSSRLLTGNTSCKEKLEQAIGSSYGKSCLLFNSGYHVNLGVLPTLTTKDDLVLADKLIHASLIDGLRLSPCRWLRYRHNDYNHLEKLLQQNVGLYQNIYVVTESLFSMDGDFADLNILIQLKDKYNFKIYLDEAHALGVYGLRGLGYAEKEGVLSKIDYLIGTLSKALASEGGFIITNEATRTYLINRCRSFIYTTAGSPINTLWALFVFNKMLDMSKERNHLCSLVKEIKTNLTEWSIFGESQIVPLPFTTNKQCLNMVEGMRSAGFWVSAIRYPTVPINKPRIRLSLTASMTFHEIKKVYEFILAQEGK